MLVTSSVGYICFDIRGLHGDISSFHICLQAV